MKTVKFLRGLEWSLGNGQCPECEGVPESWHGHPMHETADTIGHEKDCPIATSLIELGEAVLVIGGFKSKLVYESFWNDGGILEMRVKNTKSKAKSSSVV